MEEKKRSPFFTGVLRFFQLEGFKWKKQHFWIYGFLLPSLLVFIAFYLVPIVTVFISSFTHWDGYTQMEFAGLENYFRLFKAKNFLAGLQNLFSWSLLAATIHTGFGVLVAFVLYKKPVGWKIVRVVFMIPNVVSLAAWALIFRFSFDDQMGMVNRVVRIFSPEFKANWLTSNPYAFWLITFTWLFFAVIVTLVVMGDLYAIPQELYEAALIDGASPFKVLTKIELPLSRISIGTGILLSMTARIGMYEIIKLTTEGGPGNSTYSLSMFVVSRIQNYDAGYANAAGTVMILIGILMLILVNKLFRMNDSVY